MAVNGLRIGSGITVGFLGAIIGIHWSLGLSTIALILACLPLLIYVSKGRGPTGLVEVPVPRDSEEAVSNRADS